MAETPENMPPRGVQNESRWMSMCADTYRTFTSDPPAWRAGHGVVIPVEKMTLIHLDRVTFQVNKRSKSLAAQFIWGVAYVGTTEDRHNLEHLCFVYDEPDGTQEILSDTPLGVAMAARLALYEGPL